MKDSHKVSLLVFSCGANAPWLIVKTLREKFPEAFRLIGVDTNRRELVAAAELLDAFYTVPASCERSFMPTVEKIVERERPDYALPLFDFDQFAFSSECDPFRRYGVKSLATPVETLKIYKDKLLTHAACRRAGVPVPRRYDVADVDVLGRYFVKPIHGSGSVGAKEMSGAEILALENPQGVIVEEVCRKPERTLECFFFDGRLSSVCRDRLATKAGVCTKARVYKSPRLEEIARRFVGAFKVPSIFNLQFMENSEGQPVVTDVNLRTAAGMGLSLAAGWDEISAFAKVLLGRSVEDIFATLPDCIPEQFVVRTYVDKVTQSTPRTVAFDLDGTLVDSRARHRLVMDEILKRHGIALDVRDLVAYKAANRNNVEYLVSKGLAPGLAAAIQSEWIGAIESPAALAHDRLYPDAESLLASYDGWRRILLTARTDAVALDEELSRLGLRYWFDEVIVVPPGKDASSAKAAALREKKALVFHGDTLSDRNAAQEADVPFKFHANGFHAHETVFGVAPGLSLFAPGSDPSA